jgi:hypothetical protein
MRNFSKVVLAHVGTFLASRGFVYGDRVFCRTQDGGFLNLIGFDSGRWNPNLFRIMLGFNDHSLPAPHVGFVHVRYFTGGSISPAPRDLSCETEKALRSRLHRFVTLFDQVVEPFFASLTSRSQLADALCEQATMDYIRGLLYLADGDPDRAAIEFGLYLRRLRAVEAGADSHVQETIEHVGGLLARCARPNG